MSASFSRPGAVDLSALAARAQQQREAAARPTAGGPGAGSAPAGSQGLVIDADEASFQSVLELSMTVPVVLDFWADWCQPCKQLSPILERLATEYGGRFVLAKIDVDANPQLAAAAGAQSIPLVLGALRGQVLPLFNGALPEAQVRQYIEELLRVAAANGVSGTVPVGGPEDEPEDQTEPAPSPRNPRYAAADEALARGDVEAARDEYARLLAQSPADGEAKAGLVSTTVLARALATDVEAVSAAAEEDPTDVAAQAALADVEVTGGQADAAFARLLRAVQETSGDDRELARTRLVELFELVGPDDPRVATARRQLAAALF